MKGGCWVVAVDVQSFFDELDHPLLRGFLDRRVRDGVICRIPHKWQKAGVLEEGALRHPETGTPQVGVIPPLLANIYRPEVLESGLSGRFRPGFPAGASWCARPTIACQEGMKRTPGG